MSKRISLLNDWQHLFKPPLSSKERIGLGQRMRDNCSRKTLGEWKPAADRPNPIDVLRAQDHSRLQNLLPLRYGRMMKSPFTFYRGSAAIMAADLGPTPHSDLYVQLCGDCHLSNFGVFATPERNLIFDLNDFDETLPGPFEWDMKRLAASFVIAAYNNGFKDSAAEDCVLSLAKTYRNRMEEFAQMNTLEVWYQKVNIEELLDRVKSQSIKQTALAKVGKLKEKRSHAGALSKLTEVRDGKRYIIDDPPIIYHSDEASDQAIKEVLSKYSRTLWESRQVLLQKYHYVDIAAKVVGVGSVGTAAGIVLMQAAANPDDYIFLQVKQANNSVLEKYLAPSQFDHPGNRIVNGQRLLQSASDMFLGWASGPKRDFYIRQLMDMKTSVTIENLDPETLCEYAEVCGLALARAHGRSGDPAMLHGYLGKSERFDEALLKFSMRYAQQNASDYDQLLKAIKNKKVTATPGL
jgi:uncharacterized protein (DUF2252 family)